MRSTRSSVHRNGWRPAPVLGFLVVLFTGCGPAHQSPTPFDAVRDARATDLDAPGDSLSLAREPVYAGLDRVFPEIAQLELWYREALQAVWNDDLDLAEQRAALLDSALTEIDANE